MEQILQHEGLEGRAFTWEQLGMEAGVEASGWTIKMVMGSLEYHKFLACQRSWQSPRSAAANRVEYARKTLGKYPRPKDWHRVRFSDEVHFGWGNNINCAWSIRRPGERYCVDCIQHKEAPKEKDEKRFHCWAAVGYGFKPDLIFYDVPGNTNRKMSLKVYRDQILEPVVNQALVVRGSGFCIGRRWWQWTWKLRIGILFEYGRKKTISNTFSIVLLLQIFLLLRIVGCPPSNTGQNIRIGMIILPKSWFWKGGLRFLKSSSTSDVDQYSKDSGMLLEVRARWLVINCDCTVHRICVQVVEKFLVGAGFAFSASR